MARSGGLAEGGGAAGGAAAMEEVARLAWQRADCGARRSCGTCWRALEAVRLQLARGGARPTLLELLELLAVTQTQLQGRKKERKKERRRRRRRRRRREEGGGGGSGGLPATEKKNAETGEGEWSQRWKYEEKGKILEGFGWFGSIQFFGSVQIMVFH
ncbi:hypothetical protein JCGZ_23985 [Jatropha curcas]|uniref:Uncharacterized protein n=1 Tax=Jatropha curcas TaxID=180498 RepID=A0A067JM84_JATCU|nr:hypothetical protein JCGZ_23985 [Jatropha curcas]